MTPDKLDYLPCPTCGVLAPVDRPHPATFCFDVRMEKRQAGLPVGLNGLAATFCARIKQASPRAVMTDIDDIDDGLSTGPEPVTVDVEALWGGT